MAVKDKSCGTCLYAGEFRLTPSGRFKRDTSTQCGYVVRIGPRPESVGAIEERRYAVQPSSGAQCAVYEAKPSTLAQQVASAQAEVATWPQEKRDSVQLAGSSEPTRGSVGRKE